MAEQDIDKMVDIDESDPKAVRERTQDPPGSFLDLYRSQSIEHVEHDEQLVEKCVMDGIVPHMLRYGIMRRGSMETFRGVVKSADGLFYFNWPAGGAFKIVAADTAKKAQEAEGLLKSCAYGCDLLTADAMGKAGGVAQAQAATVPVDEEQFAEEQDTMATEVHPGATHAHTPDRPSRGRDWHAGGEEFGEEEEASTQAPPANKSWTAMDLIRAYGQNLQQTAPTVHPRVTSLEARYMQEVLGATSDQIEKGVRLPPRHRLGFEQWKASQLRGALNPLQSWLKRNE